ncbi:MAG: NAD(+)/NADH kinase [Helicobacter sp.]|nr:NAD(+)/NADH kinase [Helicobacter sp.]
MQNNPIHTLGVFLRPSSPQIKDDFLEFQALALDLGFLVYLDSISAGMIGMQGLDFKELCKKSDALVTLGGDGTLISTARRSFLYQKPILGINMGNLGFLTDLKKDEIATFLPQLKIGHYRIANHLLLEGKIENEEPFYALNEVLLMRLSDSSMIHIKAFIDGEYFNSYWGDGLIVATPTGSTAYNISAGGAVVYPFSNNLLVTPICPHSLTQRPLILPGEFTIQAELGERGRCNIIIDGQENKTLKHGQRIHIKTLNEGAKLIHNAQWNYFKILKEKFHWGTWD